MEVAVSALNPSRATFKILNENKPTAVRSPSDIHEEVFPLTQSNLQKGDQKGNAQKNCLDDARIERATPRMLSEYYTTKPIALLYPGCGGLSQPIGQVNNSQQVIITKLLKHISIEYHY